MILGRGREPQLREDRRDVLLDGPLGDDHPQGDAGVRAALRHEPQHLALARRELVERVVRAPAADELGDDGGIERRSALGDAAHCGREVVDVGDPVLQQVPDALGVLAEELDRIARLDV